MKVDARRLPAFLRDPGPVRAVLLYGEDAGLVRARAADLTRAVAGDLHDPFRVADLARDQVAAMASEAGALALTGGRRVVRLREGTDAATSAVQSLLNGSAPGLVVIEAGVLPPRSKLRVLMEGAAGAAVIACHSDDDRTLSAAIRGGFESAGVMVDPNALDWLVTQLGSDRGVTLREVERLALFAGTTGRIDLAAAMEGSGDLAGLSLDDAWPAATSGEVAYADRALGMALAEGATPVGVVRAGISHVQRLHRCALAVRGGTSIAEAVKTARPPVFFRAVPAFTRALQLLPEGDLRAIASRLFEAELSCKQTGAPAELVCRAALLKIAGFAASRRR